MNEFQLLSLIYKILGETSLETLLLAEQRASDAELIPVLRALYQIKESEKKKDVKPTIEIETDKVEKTLPTSSDDTRSLFEELLLNSDLKNQQLVEMLIQNGLNISFKHKESKSRLVKRASRLFSEFPRPQRQRFLIKLRKKLGINETAGWFGVLHERKN